MQNYYRAIFLSDWHMGAKTFNAPGLLNFLKNNDSEYLYLVGDIIDGWKLNKRWFWPEIYNAIFDELLRKKETGTKIIYVTGNHDEALRTLRMKPRLKIVKGNGVKIVNEIVHLAGSGKKFIVTHGDQFDRKILHGNLSRWSDRAYDWLCDRFHREGPYIEIKGKMKRFSLAKAVNTTGYWALVLLSNFESAACTYARNHHADGIICGHTHIPSLKKIKNTLYANSGGWLRDLHTALVETDDGQITLVDWKSEESPEALQAALSPVFYKGSEKTQKLVSLIHAIWPARLKQPITVVKAHYPGAFSAIRNYKKILAS